MANPAACVYLSLLVVQRRDCSFALLGMILLLSMECDYYWIRLAYGRLGQGDRHEMGGTHMNAWVQTEQTQSASR